MKIALTTKGTTWDSWMEPRFGRTDYIVIYDEENDALTSYDNSAMQNAEHGAGPKMAKVIIDLKVDVVITGNGPGENATTVLTKSGVSFFIGAGEMIAKEAYEAYKEGKLTQI